MELKLLKKGFNYSQDGPGNRLVLHLQGCNMRCRWCSNPESMALDGSLMATDSKLLPAVCPFGAVTGAGLNRSLCNGCTTRECLTQNRSSGLRLSCTTVTVNSLVAEAVQSQPLFFDGGGVTVSGGEPTLQFEGLKALLQGLKEQGIHTAIETNGTHPRLEELFPLLDLLIMDFKHYEDRQHRLHTGVSNAATKANLAKAFAQHPNLLVRTPLINGVNAAAEDMAGFTDFYTRFDTANAAFELFKYHEYGKVKWQQCGMEYTMQNGEITDLRWQEFEAAYRAKGLRVVRT